MPPKKTASTPADSEPSAARRTSARIASQPEKPAPARTEREGNPLPLPPKISP